MYNMADHTQQVSKRNYRKFLSIAVAVIIIGSFWILLLLYFVHLAVYPDPIYPRDYWYRISAAKSISMHSLLQTNYEWKEDVTYWKIFTSWSILEIWWWLDVRYEDYYYGLTIWLDQKIENEKKKYLWVACRRIEFYEIWREKGGGSLKYKEWDVINVEWIINKKASLWSEYIELDDCLFS